VYAEDIKVMSFNTGTHTVKANIFNKAGKFTKKLFKSIDKYYGNGLAWLPAVEATKNFIATHKPDIIGFQEMFDSNTCSDIPEKNKKSFICEKLVAGDPMVIQLVTGGEYQIACHLGDNEKCIAVKKSFGYIDSCVGDICLNGLEGQTIPECSRTRSRVGKAKVISHATGEIYNVINVHSTAGFKKEEKKCRQKQFVQAFTLFPGESNNIIVGDMNTDPNNKLFFFDKSAKKLRNYAKANNFNRINGDVNKHSYMGMATIDHIYSDDLERVSCKAHGVSKGTDEVLKLSYFDHIPLICTLRK